MFNRLSFQARFDAATSHSNGTATNGMLTEDHPERKRITVGSKAASFKRVIAVAAVGVFIGASMSNGMMDIARHVAESPSGNADDGRIELENFGRRDVWLLAHRPLFGQNDAQRTRVGERTCAGQTQKMGKPPDG